MKRPILVLTCLLVLVSSWMWGVPSSSAAADTDRSVVGQQQQKGEKLVEKLGITEALGPLAPVALSPFFGLTCLSATSMLCDKGILPENQFLMGNEVLNNPLVFLLFLGLTILTSAPRLLTVSKIFAEATERIETYAGIISYAAILMFAQQDGSPEQTEQVALYTAGFFSMTGSGLLACCAAVNIFVISTVRFFFELLILISPIPTLDAIFECANKTIVGILAAIYAFNPWLAFVLNVILFLICLVIFNWVNRRLRYLKALLLEPIWAGFIRSMLGRVKYDPDWNMRRKLSAQTGEGTTVVKCFPLRKIGKIKKKDRCWLAMGPDGVLLSKPRLLRSPIDEPVNPTDLSGEITEGLISYSFMLSPKDTGKECELAFSKVYTQKLDTLRSSLAGLTSAETSP